MTIDEFNALTPGHQMVIAKTILNVPVDRPTRVQEETDEDNEYYLESEVVSAVDSFLEKLSLVTIQ